MDNDILKMIENAEAEAEQIRLAAREEAAAIVAEAERAAAAGREEAEEECQKIQRRKLSEAQIIAENKEAIKKREIEDEVKALRTITSNKVDSIAEMIAGKAEAL